MVERYTRTLEWTGRWVAGWLLLGALTASGQQAGEPAAAPAEARVVERVVAVIEDRVLTLSELEFETRVALVQRGGVRAAEVRLDEETLKGALELAISQRLLVLGADRLQAFPVERTEVEARLKAFRERFTDELALVAFLTRHDADVEQLMAVLERSARAERILDSRIRLRAQVGEAEVRRYYEQHAAELGGKYESVREALKARLSRERYAELAASELAQVRANARVRRVAPFAREARR